MLRKFFAATVLVLALAIQVSAAAKGAAPAKCTSLTVDWTVYQYVWITDPSGITTRKDMRIYGDAIPESTYSGTVFSCDGASGDAVLQTSLGRKIRFDFNGAGLPGSSLPGIWNTQAFLSPPTNKGTQNVLINIRDIIRGSAGSRVDGTLDRSHYYKLYTILIGNFTGPDQQKYNLPMRNPLLPCSTTTAEGCPESFINTPFHTSFVVVEHYPGNATQKEYWLIYPETQQTDPDMAPEAGTLIMRNSYDGTVNSYGQYTMPFFFKLTVK